MFTIVYACNDGYAKLAGISLFSLLQNNKNNDFRVFIIDDKISQENKNKLLSLKSENENLLEINFIESELLINDLKTYIKGYYASQDINEGGGYTAYARLFIEKFIPSDVDRIVYIDCDTLVINDISYLFVMDLGDFPVALSFDCTNAKYKKVIGLEDHYKYFNSGVMVMDTNNWKKRMCLKRILDDIQKGISYPFVDQDFINRSLKGEILKFPFSYNFCSSYFFYKSTKAIKFVLGLDYFIDYNDDFKKSYKNPAILHFNGNAFTRPWFSNSVHPYKSIYDKYYYNSPWKEEKQHEQHVDYVNRTQLFLFTKTPRFLFLFIMRVLQFIMFKIYYHI